MIHLIPAQPAGPSEPTHKERDFLLLNVFVLMQHGYIDRAGLLVEALYAIGDKSNEVLLARAVLRFLKNDWPSALACLEELNRADPVERFGSYRLDERQRMRRYLKARCLHELKAKSGARDALEAYLRHGESGQEIAE